MTDSKEKTTFIVDRDNGSDRRIIPGLSIDRLILGLNSKHNENFDEELHLKSSTLLKKINQLSQTFYTYREITSEFKNDLKINPFAHPRRSQSMLCYSMITTKHIRTRNLKINPGTEISTDVIAGSENKIDGSKSNVESSVVVNGNVCEEVGSVKPCNYDNSANASDVNLVNMSNISHVKTIKNELSVNASDDFNSIDMNICLINASEDVNPVDVIVVNSDNESDDVISVDTNKNFNVRNKVSDVMFLKTIKPCPKSKRNINRPCPKSKKTKLPLNDTAYSLHSTLVLKTKKQYPPPFPIEYLDELLSEDQSLALNLIVKSKGIEVILIWNKKNNNSLGAEPIKNYELFMCKETDKEPESSMWKLEEKLTALNLPMMCKFNVYDKNFSYYIAVRAVDGYNRRGPCSFEKVTIL